MNSTCQVGDYALVLRSRHREEIGIVVKVLFSDRFRSTAAGKKVWDVEAPRGRFFPIAEECLCPLRGWRQAPGTRDELFDAHQIFSDPEPFLTPEQKLEILRKRFGRDS